MRYSPSLTTNKPAINTTSGLPKPATASAGVRIPDKASAMIACTFGQRQGAVTISRSDGVTHDLTPVGDAPGNFRDQRGSTVYRQSGLGDQGLIFRFPDESVYVYWNTAALEPATPDHPTWSFTTQDYDATTLLRCRAAVI